jgi:hypothetical protein
MAPSLACTAQIWNVLRSVSEPFGSKFVILLPTFAIFIFLPQYDLRIGIARFSRPSIPLQGQLGVHGTEPILLIREVVSMGRRNTQVQPNLH